MNDRSEIFAISSTSPGHYVLTGELSFGSVELALQKTAKFFLTPAQMVFDLADIGKADSAGLALLIEWLGLASKGGVELHYANLPPQLLAMARVAGVDEILFHSFQPISSVSN
jgi:phospholipid transport system transporter-binding protein